NDLGIVISHVCTQRLHPRPVGRCAAGLPAAADEHLGVAFVRAAGQLLGEAALPDAGLAADQEHAAPAGNDLVQPTEELAQLRVAADERATTVGPRVDRGGLVVESAGRLERALLGEDRALEFFERLARLQPELLGERTPRLLVALQCLRLTAGTIESEHE